MITWKARKPITGSGNNDKHEGPLRMVQSNHRIISACGQNNYLHYLAITFTVKKENAVKIIADNSVL